MDSSTTTTRYTRETKTDEIEELISLALEKYEDWEDATDYITRLILSDKSLFNSVVPNLVRNWVKSWVRQRAATDRQRIVRAKVSNVVARVSDKAQAVRESCKNSLMDFPLPGGVLLRNATKPVLLATVDMYAANAKTNWARGLWLRSVAERLEDDDTRVGDALSDEEVRTLFNRGQSQSNRRNW